MISNYSKICDKHVRSIKVLNLKEVLLCFAHIYSIKVSSICRSSVMSGIIWAWRFTVTSNNSGRFSGFFRYVQKCLSQRNVADSLR